MNPAVIFEDTDHSFVVLGQVTRTKPLPSRKAQLPGHESLSPFVIMPEGIC